MIKRPTTLVGQSKGPPFHPSSGYLLTSAGRRMRDREPVGPPPSAGALMGSSLEALRPLVDKLEMDCSAHLEAGQLSLQFVRDSGVKAGAMLCRVSGPSRSCTDPTGRSLGCAYPHMNAHKYANPSVSVRART